MLTVLGGLAEFERELIRSRTDEGRIFAARLDGRDPAEQKKQSRRCLVVDRIDDLVESFIQEHVSQIKTGRRISSLLRRDVIAYWGTKSIHEIKKRDVSELVSLIAQRNAVASHRMLKTLKTFFRWCVAAPSSIFLRQREFPRTIGKPVATACSPTTSSPP